MKDIIQLQQTIAPEVTSIIQQRYDILRGILFHQPIGRRSLASLLSFSERVIRGEVDFLQELNLIRINQWGMSLTEEGEEMITHLEHYIRQMGGLSSLEQTIVEHLHLPKVIIVPGDASHNPQVKKELGRAAAHYLKTILQPGQIMAVTGGSTLAEVAEGVSKIRVKMNVLVVPARGGLGEQVEIQANTIAAQLGRHLGGEYRLLHVPDNLSEAALTSLQKEKSIQDILQLLSRSNLVVHGIGTLTEMANRRGYKQEDVKKMVEKGAVGEALGYYIDSTGKIIDVIHSIGLHLDELKNFKQVVAVAGGSNKAAAILACMYASPGTVLVTDQGAAEEMVKRIHHQNDKNKI